MRWWCLFLWLAIPLWRATAALPVLTQASQIRRLSAEEANRGYPVRLRAVVTYFSTHDPNLAPAHNDGQPAPDLFVQDSTAGIFVNLPRDTDKLRAGDLIELDGITEAPDFSPQIGKPHWRVIGRRFLPAPKRVSFDQMAATTEDSQYVEVDGVVHTAELQGGTLMLDVAVSGGRLRALLPEFDKTDLDTLPDAEVRIRGVCGALFNQKNQLIGVLLYVLDPAQIQVTRTARTNPFNAPLESLSRPQRFTPENLTGHRIHVRGAVTFQKPEDFAYMTDSGIGLRVETRQAPRLHAGDVVDVIGFPHLMDFRPVLEDATVHVLGGGVPPQPVRARVRDLMDADYDSALVSVEARLLEKSLIPGRQALLLEADGVTVTASMEAAHLDNRLHALRNGSLLRLTAICEAQKDKLGRNESIRLLVDEPEDIFIVSQASWWTVPRALAALGSAMLIAGAALMWVGMLRRRVKAQTAVIRQRYEREAALEKNYRRLFLHHPHPMWVYDQETLRFLAVNEAAVAQYSYSPDEFLEMNIFDLRSVEEATRLKRDLSEGYKGLQNSGIWVHRTKEGSPIEVEIVSHDLSFADRQARLVMAVDVSERERTKRLEQDRREIVEAIAQRRPLEEIMRKLMETLESQVQGLVMSVMRSHASGLEFMISHLPEAVVEEMSRQARRPEPQGALEHAFRTVSADNGNAHPFWRTLREAAQRGGYETCWAAPITSGSGCALGALLACRGDGRSPDAAERELVDMAAQLAAVAIEQNHFHDRLLFQAHHDTLTGLPNRILLNDRLSQCVARARRGGTAFAVLQIDLDRFKLINDCLGHAIGDTLLKSVADRLGSAIRQTDTLARVGGDEFTLLLTDLKSAEDAKLVAEQLLEVMRKPFNIQGNETFVTASIGMAFYPQDATDPSTLLKKADNAMYRAKSKGKDGWHGLTPVMEMGNRLELENSLHRALERNELEVFYQPMFRTATRAVAGMEALVRWRHPRLGLVPPAQFIPIAEETGLIIPIGIWVMKEACREATTWQDGHAGCKISVNVSAVQFGRDDLVQTVASVLKETGLDPSRLELEVTEGVVMESLERSGRQLEELRALGVSIAIDDFGTGYSALSYLQHLPVDYIKIDQSFIREMEGGPNAVRLVRAIVKLAHGLGLKVTAEGIETEAQLSALRTFDCDQVQGFLLGEPLPLPETLDLAS